MLLKEKHSAWRNNENLRQRNKEDKIFTSKHPPEKLNIISSRRNFQTCKLSNIYLLKVLKIQYKSIYSVENHTASLTRRFVEVSHYF